MQFWIGTKADEGAIKIKMCKPSLHGAHYTMGFWRNGGRVILDVTGVDRNGHERTGEDIFL